MTDLPDPKIRISTLIGCMAMALVFMAVIGSIVCWLMDGLTYHAK
jgi:hypothetical protein